MRRSGVSPAASVSPLVKPMRISLISGEGDLRIPSFTRSHVVGDGPNTARGGGVIERKRKKERNPLQRGYSKGHRCPRGVYSPILEGWVSKRRH